MSHTDKLKPREDSQEIISELEKKKKKDGKVLITIIVNTRCQRTHPVSVAATLVVRMGLGCTLCTDSQLLRNQRDRFEYELGACLFLCCRWRVR